jgi:short-subunit dehydrogenase
LVAGASEGIGVAFAQALAARGMNLVLVARRKTLLDKVAEDLNVRFGTESLCIDGDLAATDFPEKLQKGISDLDLGLVVYNAAHAPVGDFAEVDTSDLMRVVDVNVRGPVKLLRMVLPSMIERKRGAVILMSSLAGNQGTPRIAAYAASKAFNRVLAEGLWYELKNKGIDVISCFAGAVRTPGYADAVGKDAPGTLDPGIVVEKTLSALGRRPLVIPGFINLAAYWIMSRLFSRRMAICIMAGSTKNIAQSNGTKESS